MNRHLPQPINVKDYLSQPITEQVTAWVGPVRQGHKHKKDRRRSLVDCGLSRQPRRHIGTVNSLGPFKKKEALITAQQHVYYLLNVIINYFNRLEFIRNKR